jgi:hypothetical protein
MDEIEGQENRRPCAKKKKKKKERGSLNKAGVPNKSGKG